MTEQQDTFQPDWQGDDYQEAATPRGLRLPPKGPYRVRFPETLAEDILVTTKGTEIPLYTIRNNAVQILIPSLIVEEGPVGAEDASARGYEMRFVRVNSKQIKGQQASSAGDVLVNAGVSKDEVLRLQREGTLDDWKQQFQALAGQSLPSPVYCDWEAVDSAGAKAAIAAGTPTNDAWNAARVRGMGPSTRSKGRRFDVSDGNGGFLPYVDTGRQEPDPKNPGQTRTVRLYANLVPSGPRAFAPSKGGQA